MIARTRTLALIRHLAAIGPLQPAGRGRPLPRAAHPDLIADEYARELVDLVVRPAARAAAEIRAELLHLLDQHRRLAGKHDGARLDAGEDDRAQHLIDVAAKRAAAAMRPTALHAVAERFGRATSLFQRQQLDRQVRAAMGVPLDAIERPIVDKIPAFIDQNVALVKTVQERYWERLKGDVKDAFAGGMHPTTLAELFVERDGMAEGDAARIARDQIGKLNGQINQARQESLGVDSFVWRTMRDNRVRDSHDKLDGETFPWDDPPIDDDTGEVITPGSAIQCRCYAEPVFPAAGGDDEG